MPYWRLSAFYLFYFASLGALIPYWSLYLQGLGFGAAEIGELIAILMGTKLIAPNVWGWMADRFGRRMAIIRLASLLSAVTFVGVFFGEGFWWLALVMTVFSFFWNASLPQFEATTLSHLGDSTHRYSTIRLWGSIGFIVTVAGMGWLLGVYGTGLLPKVLLALFLGIWFASLCAPEDERHGDSEHLCLRETRDHPVHAALGHGPVSGRARAEPHGVSARASGRRPERPVGIQESEHYDGDEFLIFQDIIGGEISMWPIYELPIQE